MSIVTKGLGSSSIVTGGYGWLRAIVKKIVEVIARLIPKRRRKVEVRIPVHGNPAIPIEVPVLVAGNPFEVQRIKLPTLGSPAMSFRIETPMLGSPIYLTQEKVNLTGDLSESVTSHLEILGTSSSRFELQLSCRGEKDFSKMLWEILEEENDED